MSSIADEIYKQSQGMDMGTFKCATCKNYKGGCCCEKWMFIAFEGANLSGCQFYEMGRKCPHCGRIV